MKARIIFCAWPALLIGVLIGMGTWSKAAGALAFAVLFGLGWDVTRPRPERGEGQ